MCQMWVEERLAAPASADFPFGGAAGMQDLGAGKYGITSYVDAQNRFGATLRTDYDCTV